MSRIPIKAVRELANRCGLSHCIVFAYDGKLDHIATYGKSIEACGQAADFGNQLKEELGWPKTLQTQPSRVRRLQARVKELEAQVQELKDRIAGAIV